MNGIGAKDGCGGSELSKAHQKQVRLTNAGSGMVMSKCVPKAGYINEKREGKEEYEKVLKRNKMKLE